LIICASVKFNAILKQIIDMLFLQRPSDRAYFIAKELLVTERTYRKDLEVISFVSSFLLLFKLDLIGLS